MTGRIYAIGDIHGCLDHLDRLLDTIPFNAEKDRLVFVGDYIDRGPDPYGTVQRVLEIKRTHPKTICLMGNHERMFLDFLSGKDAYSFLYNGGKSTLESYSRIGAPLNQRGDTPPPEHKAFYDRLLLYFETENHIFVHAGLRPGVPLLEQNEQDLLWIRGEFYDSNYDFGKTVIFGHTPFRKPLITKNCIGIDTGAVYGNVLTCLALPDLVFYQS
ncbi:MAG: serine/threonine protein phosphatase [Deltaproteobacteria bacterium]|nr:serine/threonine protein phosphatase [Deltaproteobacteria bacterium]